MELEQIDKVETADGAAEATMRPAIAKAELNALEQRIDSLAWRGEKLAQPIFLTPLVVLVALMVLQGLGNKASTYVPNRIRSAHVPVEIRDATQGEAWVNLDQTVAALQLKQKEGCKAPVSEAAACEDLELMSAYLRAGKYGAGVANPLRAGEFQNDQAQFQRDVARLVEAEDRLPFKPSTVQMNVLERMAFGKARSKLARSAGSKPFRKPTQFITRPTFMTLGVLGVLGLLLSGLGYLLQLRAGNLRKQLVKLRHSAQVREHLSR